MKRKRKMLSFTEVERAYFTRLLVVCGQDRTKAAEMSGLGVRTIHRKVVQFDLPYKYEKNRLKFQNK